MSDNRKGITITVISTLGIIILVVSLFVYTMTQPRIMSVKDLVSNGAITYQEPIAIKPFQLIDQDRNIFSPAQFNNQWTLLFFGFSHCGGFCPTTLALLDQFVSQLEPDIAANTQVIMVSVDPARDTPERLKEYMGNFNSEFVGLTGDLATIKLLSEQFYIAFQPAMAMAAAAEDDEHAHHQNQYDVAHGEQIVLINPEGNYHGFFKPPFALARLKTTYQSIVLTYNRNQ